MNARKGITSMNLSTIKSFLGLVVVFTFTTAAAASACLFEALSYALVRPFSLSTHRHITLRFTRAFFLISTFLLEIWSNITFKMYGDRVPKDKSFFVILNHSSSLDFLIGLAYLAKLGFPYPGNAKSAVKAALGNVPLFGTTLFFAEFIFLSRAWAADRVNFVNSLLSLRNYEQVGSPLCFVLFPEGTRLTPDRLRRSNEHTKAIGEPPMNYVLYPRFKGFTTVIETMQDRFDGILDATLMFEGSQPSLKDSLSGKCDTVVHVHTTYFPMKDLPKGDEQLQKWIRDRWYEKEERISSFNRNISSLGKQDSFFFPNEKPSLIPLYGLVVSFSCLSIACIHLFSKIPNGILILSLLSVTSVVVVGVLTMISNRPSGQGSHRRTNLSR